MLYLSFLLCVMLTIMKRSDMYLSVKEGMKAAVLERVVAGEIAAGKGARLLSMSIRQVFRLKARIRESGQKPFEFFFGGDTSMVRSKGMGEYRGASLNHMSELLGRNEGVWISAKSVGRILKEAGATNPHTRKSPKKFKRRK